MIRRQRQSVVQSIDLKQALIIIYCLNKSRSTAKIRICNLKKFTLTHTKQLSLSKQEIQMQMPQYCLDMPKKQKPSEILSKKRQDRENVSHRSVTVGNKRNHHRVSESTQYHSKDTSKHTKEEETTKIGKMQRTEKLKELLTLQDELIYRREMKRREKLKIIKEDEQADIKIKQIVELIKQERQIISDQIRTEVLRAERAYLQEKIQKLKSQKKDYLLIMIKQKEESAKHELRTEINEISKKISSIETKIDELSQQILNPRKRQNEITDELQEKGTFKEEQREQSPQGDIRRFQPVQKMIKRQQSSLIKREKLKENNYESPQYEDDQDSLLLIDGEKTGHLTFNKKNTDRLLMNSGVNEVNESEQSISTSRFN